MLEEVGVVMRLAGLEAFIEVDALKAWVEREAGTTTMKDTTTDHVEVEKVS